ncbi:MAG TPA: adenylate/guanylate cyclase domain-containing protein [Solirubrobacteraceae bacterium]|nr:adenylate/guanylate cyclase domain-containing protein [Solirubrobacteraceae bacterium]
MSMVAPDPLAAGRDAFARRHWEDAFGLLTAADRERPLAPRDIESLAEAACWTRRYDDMLELLERAEAGYEREGDCRGAARTALALTREHYQRNHDAPMGAWMMRAARLLDGQPDCHETGLLLWMKVRGLLFIADDLPGALAAARELVELARRLGDPDLEALALLDEGHALISLGQAQEGSALLDEATALAMTGASDLTTAGTVYCSTIFACRNIGDWQRASQWTDESLRWCERNSVSGFPGLCRLHRAEIIRLRGSLSDAQLEAEDACAELRAWAPRYAGWAYNEVGEIRRRRGDLAGARSAFAESLEVGFDPQPGLALLRLDEGDPAAALIAINRRLQDRDVFTQESRVLLLPAQVTIALAAGDLAVAHAALAELDDAVAEYDSVARSACAAVARGEVAVAEARTEDAVAALREGCRLWATIGARFEAAQARVLLGRAYGLADDAQAARLEWDGARKTFAELGAWTEEQRVDRLLNDLTRNVRQQQTFVFTDIVDSTRLVELLGDDGWDTLLAWHDRTVRECLSEHHGREIKHEGDGFFIAFEAAQPAVEFAIALQRSFDLHRREHGFAPRLRIGVHAAEATRRGGDFFGHGVHVAARVAAAGSGDEILATASTLADAGDRVTTMPVNAIALKGVTEPVEIAKVDWR